jgi:cobyrinic acid a,c-diamide synthase
MAKWLGLPVVLVIDVYSMARSAAALLRGFSEFDPELKIAGVIFNRVGGDGHYRMLEEAVRDVPIFGWLPVDASVEIPERHLGLLTASELTAGKIREIGEFVEHRIDLNGILSILGKMGNSHGSNGFNREICSIRGTSPFSRRVAIAQDKAFSFYYHANRLALEEGGAKIIEFSPLTDREVPDADFLYIGGGYPELYRRDLEANAPMRSSIRKFIESGKKFYAECGGLMYLAQSIGESKMVGIIPAEIEMTERLVDFGYCEITTTGKSILGPAGTAARGHQFHYSRCVSGFGSAYQVRQGQRYYTEGFVFPNGIASYIHLHFLSNPALARNMLNS